MLTSWSEQLTPPALSIASVLIRPPPSAYSIRPRWVRPEVAALADDAAAQLRAVDADGVVGLVARVGVGLRGGLDVRADAAVPQQVDRRAQDRPDQLVRRQAVGLDAERPPRRRRERNRLGGARPHAAALGDQRRVVVGPRGARQLEQPPALGERGRGIGVGVEEDVAVVERRDQPDVAGQQHAVAEHVARHVADPDDREVGRLDVGPELAEVALDRLPRAAGGDAHLLVVVADRAAGGERVAEPEAVLGRDRVREVGERRGALVGRDDEVRVVAVVAHDVARRHDRAVDDVVGEVEQAADERPVAGDDLVAQGLAAAVRRRPLDHEAALGADGHDQRVLDHLGLHQAEDLGAEVLAAVRPAQAAAGDLAAAQVHALRARRVDEDLEARARRGHERDAATGRA